MNLRNHHIGKLVFNLEFDSEQTAGELQKSFPEAFEPQVKLALDEVFSSFSNNGETIVVDHLKINLGEISLENFTETLKKEVKNSLRKLLTPEKNDEISDEVSDEVAKISPLKTSFEILLFFLKNGYFPWWANEITLQQLEASVLSETSYSDPNILSKFRNTISSPTCHQRLAMQFSENFNREIIAVFYPESADFIFKTIGQIKNTFVKNDISDVEIRLEWPVVVWPLLVENTDKTILHKKIPAKIISAFCDHLNYQIILTQMPDNLVFDRHLLLDKNPEIENNFQDRPTNPENLFENISEKKGPSKPEKKEHSTTEMIVSNCGMVVFWPFLEQFFEELALMEHAKFITDIHQEKAVLITQFLVSGQTEAAESQLPLNKILTGWPMNKPLRKDMFLDENEKIIAEDFLKEIIKNWSALKSTSIAGLRETFLQREGILRENSQKRTLKIERKTVDILRDSLSWPISIIKLPWMDKILYVEW